MNTPPTNISSPPLVVGFISLGCPKNLIDSERMLASLALDGFVVTGDLDAADVAVVNTCAFIEEARRESGEAIGELVRRKRRGHLQMVIVAGCYPQLDAEGILEQWPEVDAVVGVAARERITAVIRGIVQQGSDLPVEDVPPIGKAPVDDHERLRLTPRHFAYLRLTEGCDNRCSYCTIPQIRGALHSKPLSMILTEAAELVDDGVRELILIGQDTTAYGRDLKGRLDIADVLSRLDGLPGVTWLRLLYAHPASFSRRLVESYASLEHLLPYVDLPIQHISQPILDSMGRHTTRQDVERLIQSLRSVREDLVLRTTFIVGYPGETDDQFAELLDFVRQVRFDRLGAFAYSKESGTRAAALPGHVSPKTKRERLHALMALQQGIALENHHRHVGRRIEVIIDQGSNCAGQAAIGRIWGQAPDIDGVTHVTGRDEFHAGELVTVEITAAGPYDLEARAVAR